MAFDAKEDKIVKLLSQNLLEIPRNQRKYVWGKTNWADLLSDIVFIVDNNCQSQHFLGSIVLRSEEDVNGLEKYSIIDGQQRTITIILFLLALIRLFKENDMKEDADGTFQYLFFKDRKNIEHLVLHSENHLPVTDLSNVIRKAGKETDIAQVLADVSVTKSDKIFKDGFEYFYDALRSLANKKGAEYLVKIKDSLLDARFIRINADSDADAYTVFEILNARGLGLEGYELLKNYIMRYITPKEKVDEVKVKWASIEQKLGKHIEPFFRHYVIHKIGPGSSEVYRTLQKHFPKEEVNSLLNDLHRKAELYSRIVNPSRENEYGDYQILAFLRSKRSQQLRPLILSLLSAADSRKIENQEYLKYLSFLKNFFICFTIIASEKSNKLTEVIEKYAPLIEKDSSLTTLEAFEKAMRKKLPSFATFKRIFSDLGYSQHYDFYKESRYKSQVSTVLELIESHLSPGFSFEDGTIEHILPDSEAKENALIGNLTFLEKSINKNCKNKPLAEKLNAYSDSNFRMTRRLASRYGLNNGSDFNPANRAEAMAKLIYNEIFKFGDK